MAKVCRMYITSCKNPTLL